MRSKLLIIFSSLLLAAATVSAQEVVEIYLDSVTNTYQDSCLVAGSTHVFMMHYTNMWAGGVGWNMNPTNGFRVYSRDADDVNWDTLVGADMNGFGGPIPGWSFYINYYSATGTGADTVGFGGFGTSLPTGLPNLWDSNSVSITIGPTRAEDHGKWICIDSTKYGNNTWKWAALPSAGGSYYPDWSGDTCFMVYDPGTSADDRTEDLLPDRFALAQNYPNPFNPSTVIKFDLPRRARVTLAVYNVLGQRVKTLVDEEVDAGFHQESWDGRTASGKLAATGIYFYRLETDSFVRTKKMMLLK